MFKERQHLLRLNSAGSFRTLIVPRRKGAAREAGVTRDGSRVTVTEGDAVTTFDGDSVSVTAGGKQSRLDLTKSPPPGSSP